MDGDDPAAKLYYECLVGWMEGMDDCYANQCTSEEATTQCIALVMATVGLANPACTMAPSPELQDAIDRCGGAM